jgi:hypothetical protein
MQMLARTQIGVEEYLDLVFDDRPEPDYVHGEVVERGLPDVLHSRIKALLAVGFEPLSKRADVTMMTGYACGLSPSYFELSILLPIWVPGRGDATPLVRVI